MSKLNAPDTTTTADEVNRRLKAAGQQIGRGRFCFTFDPDGRDECFITHWFKPDPYAFEDCKSVAAGPLRTCLDELDRYVAANAPAQLMAAE